MCTLPAWWQNKPTSESDCSVLVSASVTTPVADTAGLWSHLEAFGSSWSFSQTQKIKLETNLHANKTFVHQVVRNIRRGSLPLRHIDWTCVFLFGYPPKTHLEPGKTLIYRYILLLWWITKPEIVPVMQLYDVLLCLLIIHWQWCDLKMESDQPRVL